MASELGLIYSVGRHWTGSMIELGYNRNSFIESSSSDWTIGEDAPVYTDDGLINNTSPWRFLEKHDFGKILKDEYTNEYVLKKLIAISKNPRIATTTFISTHRLNKTISADNSDKEPTVLSKSIERWLLKVIRDKAQIRHSLTNLAPSGTSCSRSKTPCPLFNLHRTRPIRSRSSEREVGSGRGLDLYHRHIEETCSNSSSLCWQPMQIGSMLASKRKRQSLSDSEIFYATKEGQQVDKKDSSSEQKDAKKNEAENNSTDAVQPTPLVSAADSEDNPVSTVSDQPEDNGEKTKFEEATSDVSKVPNETADTENTAAAADSPVDGGAAPPAPSESESDPAAADTSTVKASEESPQTPSPKPTEPTSDNSQHETHRQGRTLTHSKTTSELHKKPRKAVRFADEEGFPIAQEHLVPDTSLPPILHRKRLDSFDDDYLDFAAVPSFHRSFSTSTCRASERPKFSLPPVPMPGQISARSNDYEQSSPADASPMESSWRLTFAQPAAQYLAFRQRLDTGCVSLENVTVSTPKDNACAVRLYGTVKVKNINFEKHVKLRVTENQWKSFKDYPASHNLELSTVNGAGGRFDTFIFNFSIHFPDSALAYDQNQELQFAVCFQAGPNGSAGEYWDNNDGCNYIVQRQASPKPFMTRTNSLTGATIPSTPSTLLDAGVSPSCSSDKKGGQDGQFFRIHPSRVMGAPGCSTSAAGDSVASISAPTPYTIDFRPNFAGFSSLTSYSSWQHYSNESMYY